MPNLMSSLKSSLRSSLRPNRHPLPDTLAVPGPLGQPHWFGPEDRRRFSMVHWPVGSAPDDGVRGGGGGRGGVGVVRGGVVICPPLAQEAVCAHASLRLLAEQLAARGIVVMRIDYDGTSNSVGSHADPDRVGAWRASIVDALDQLRDWGVGPLGLVGLRFGATLASEVAAGLERAADDDGSDGVECAVLWDPVVSGRRFSRELQLFSSTNELRPPPGGGIALTGITFTTDTLAGIKATKLRPLDVPTLVVARSERADVDGPPDADALGPHAERREMDGTEAMLDTDAELSVIPGGIVAATLAWIDRRMPSAGTTIGRPTLSTTARERVGDVVLEHDARRLRRNDLFALATRRVDATPIGTVMMLNNGVAPSIGPGRAWVELASEIARAGWLAVRLDIDGLGDSPPMPGLVADAGPAESYPVGAGRDVGAAVDEMGAGSGPVVLIGLCSGALLSFDAALATPVDLIISINGRFDRAFADPRRDRAERAADPTNRLLAIPLGKTPLFPTLGRIPTPVWHGLAALHLVADPAQAIRNAADEGVRSLLVTGEDEWGLLALRSRGGRRFDELVADPNVTLAIIDGLDHSMFDVQAKDEVLGIVIAALDDELARH